MPYCCSSAFRVLVAGSPPGSSMYSEIRKRRSAWPRSIPNLTSDIRNATTWGTRVSVAACTLGFYGRKQQYTYDNTTPRRVVPWACLMNVADYSSSSSTRFRATTHTHLGRRAPITPHPLSASLHSYYLYLYSSTLTCYKYLSVAGKWWRGVLLSESKGGLPLACCTHMHHNHVGRYRLLTYCCCLLLLLPCCAAAAGSDSSIWYWVTHSPLWRIWLCVSWRVEHRDQRKTKVSLRVYRWWASTMMMVLVLPSTQLPSQRPTTQLYETIHGK